MFRNISVSGWLIIIAIVFPFVMSYVSHYFSGVVRVYESEGMLFDYTYADMAFYLSQAMGWLLVCWVARIKSRHEKLTRCVCQYGIDLVVVDMAYIIFSNPYEWNKQKIIMNVIATGLFVLVYYLEYISLWYYNYLNKIKNVFNRKENGRKS